MAPKHNLAVISQSGATLSFFDIESGKRTEFIEDLIQEPHELCLDESRNVMYITHAYRYGFYWKHGDNAHEISIYDLKGCKVVDCIDIAPFAGPHGVRFHAASDTLYCSVEAGCKEAGGVIGIDLKTRKVIGSVASGSKSHWMVITPDAKKAYTCNKTDEFVSSLDIQNWKVIKNIVVPGSEELDITPDGKYVYVPTPSTQFASPPVDPCFKVVDTKTDEIVKSVPLSRGPGSIHVTSRGTIMVGQYQIDQGASSVEHGKIVQKPGLLSLFEPETFKLLGEVETGCYPLTLRSSADASVGYTANIWDGTVSVLDLDKFEEIRRLTVDTERRPVKGLQGAHGMVLFS